MKRQIVADASILLKYLKEDNVESLSDQVKKNADVNLDGKVDGSDLSLLYLFIRNNITEFPNIKIEIKYGDVNLDGKVNISDAAYLKGYLSGEKTLSNEAKANADVNADGDVDESDLSILEAYCKGDITELPSQKIA